MTVYSLSTVLYGRDSIAFRPILSRPTPPFSTDSYPLSDEASPNEAR